MNTLLLILECGILLNSATTIGATDENPLQHRTESFTIALQGLVAAVTPLFGPVQEVEWAPGWKPQFIHPTEGAQRDGVVFRTIGTNGERLWTLTTYDEKAGPRGVRVHCAWLPTNNAFTGEMRSMQL
jgi:hypothetical protein